MNKYPPLYFFKAALLSATQLLFFLGCCAQTTMGTTLGFATELALRADYGVVYAHTFLVANTAGSYPRGVSFELSKLLTDKTNWDYYRCYPRTGLLFSVVDFDSKILGHSYSSAYFLEPNYRLGKNGSFFVRGAVGLSYLTNPYDSIKNPTNQSYSLPVNFYLSLGAGLNYAVGKHWAFSVMANFQHNSNGGFSMPNHGINFPTASLGVRYGMGGNSLPKYPKPNTVGWQKSRLGVDVGVYYSPKSGYKPLVNNTWVSERKYVVGTYVQVSKQVNPLHAVTAMLEAYKDGGLQSIKRNLGDNSSSVLAGFMVGHEFVFHHIIFSQQLGVYVYKETSTFSRLYFQAFPEVYHRWGLRYKINQHLYAGINLLAHNQVADFIDVRASWRF